MKITSPKQTVRHRICMRVIPVAKVPGQLEWCDSPGSECPCTQWLRWRILWAFIV